MTVTVKKGRAEGFVTAPPSKSDAHRALISAALSGGCTVKNLAFSKDIEATVTCLHKMGAGVKPAEEGLYIGGLNPENVNNDEVLDCFESGSTLRFLLPLCMLSGKRCILTGSERLLSRPLSVYEDICRRDGIEFSNDGRRITVCGRLAGGDYEVPGDISSQFITGLLFALPLCGRDSRLTVQGRFESASYVDITLNVLARFGVSVTRTGNCFYIPGGQRFTGTEYTVEGDCSNAAFLDGFNLLGGNVTVGGLREETLQGDMVYREMFRRLRCEENPCFDLSDCPDLGPVMFALAAARGGARFVGTRRLKIKESDRGECMRRELAKFGITVIVGENEITVKKGELSAPEVPLCGHNDHRIVMALCLLCTLTGGRVEGAEAVSKSFPDFFKKLQSLKIGIIRNDT